MEVDYIMNFLDIGFKRIAIIATYLLLVTIFEPANASTKSGIFSTTETQNQQSPDFLLAQIPNFCQEAETAYILAETQDYWVNICGGDSPYTYVGVDRKNNRTIRLPLSEYDPEINQFEAKTGDTTYRLSLGTAKGDVLVVEKGDTEILRQFVIRWE